MHEWNLKAGDPLSLSLAADSRIASTDYCNDQIWELTIGAGEPPALALQTTYGLRARSSRIFPRFVESETGRSDPSVFARQPVVKKIFPNYIQVDFSPFISFNVTAEYWAAASQVIVGRFHIHNDSLSSRILRLELIAQLNPSLEGGRMSPMMMGLNSVLCGKTGDLAPLVFLTGGPEAAASPYPSLQLMLELSPGERRQLTWSHAAMGEPAASFEAARQAAARNLDAELARIELQNSEVVEIITGDPDWDAAFALAQKTARSLFLTGNPLLPNPSFVAARQPDYGYSRRGDGGDYSPLWSGQGALDSYFLAGMLLPSGTQLLTGLIMNYLFVQADNGSIDWKPGLGGQRSQLLATPILASLAWKVFRQTEDLSFLQKVFNPLLQFFKAWFTPEQDRDGDGFPEWSHSLQTGLDDHPLFAFWHPWAQGVDITTAESPALGAFLYKECQVLIAMAKKLGVEAEIPGLEAAADSLRTAVEISWDTLDCTYTYLDRDSHFSSKSEQLAGREGAGDISLRRTFEHPIRVLVKIQAASENTIRPVVFIHGTTPGGQHLVERITNERFQWFMGSGTVTGERIYGEIERIDVQGLGETDQVIVQSVGYNCQDITLLLPLWAGIPVQERVQALVEETVTNPQRYWRPYGMAACAVNQNSLPEAACQDVHIPWNTLIGEGLLAYGYRKETADLIARLMRAVISSLKKETAFRRIYQAETGQGKGERNALEGLAPLGLFLDTLGVSLITPKRVVVSGFNPFPWPVTVKYRGLTVLKLADKTTVIFPDGQTVTIDDPASQEIRLD